LTAEQQTELCLRTFQKAWIAYTKYLKHELITKRMVVQCPYFGSFSQIANFEHGDTRIAYGPPLDFLNLCEYEVKLPTNQPSSDSLVQMVEVSRV
jgi:hypothetical protein